MSLEISSFLYNKNYFLDNLIHQIVIESILMRFKHLDVIAFE